MGSPEQNKALVRRFLDCLQSGDVAGAAECFDTERYYSHAHRANLAGTWEQMKARRRSTALTDIQSETVALVADGDRVVHHSRATATHSGEFLGIPATGRRFTMDFIELWRIDGDKIVEHWGGTREIDRVREELTAGGAT
jgi:predicted ester cyclase